MESKPKSLTGTHFIRLLKLYHAPALQIKKKLQALFEISSCKDSEIAAFEFNGDVFFM